MENNENKWESTRRDLQNYMFGFNQLIDSVQGLIIGDAIATGGIFATESIKDTLHYVNKIVAEFNSMTQAFGYEK